MEFYLTSLIIGLKMHRFFIFGCLFFLCVNFSSSLYAQEFKLSIQSGHSKAIKTLKFNKSSELLVSTGEDKKCIVWELKTRRQLQTIVTTSVPEHIFFLSCDSLLVTADKKEITLWNIISGKKNAEIRVPFGITSCFEDKNGNIVYTTNIIPNGSLNNIILGDSSNKFLPEERIRTSYVGLDKITLKESFSYKLPDGFVAVPYGDSIFISNTTTNCGFAHCTPDKKTPIRPLMLSKSEGNKIKNQLQHKIFLVNEYEKMVYFINSERIQVKKITPEINLNKLGNPFTIDIKSPFEMISSAGISAHLLIVGYGRGDINIRSSKNGKTLKYLKYHQTPIYDIAISPDEKYFASCSSEEIILWDLQSFNPIHCFSSSSGNITTFNISADKRKLAIANSNGMLQYWNLETNEIILGKANVSGSMNTTYVRDINILNDSITELSVLFGLKSGLNLTKATEYYGKWFIHKNKIELQPIRKHSLFDEDIKIEESNSHSVKNKSGNVIIRSYLNSLAWYKTEYYKDTNLIFLKEKAHQDRITCLRIDEENGLLYSSSEDGALKIWGLQTGEELVTLLSYGKDFLYLSPENYYYSSKGSIQNVGFRKGLSVYPFEQFDIIYNRPEKVLSRIPLIDKQELQLFSMAYEKRIKWLGLKDSNLKRDFNKAPILKITSEKIKSTEKNNYLLGFSIADSLSGITAVNILINGVNYSVRNYQGQKSLSDTMWIGLNHGKNYVQIFATNASGVSSFREGFYIEQTTTSKPDLYLITIGSGKFNQKDYNLKYAAKDAADVADFFRKNKIFKKTHTKTIINEDVNRYAVMAAIESLKNISINDHVVVFYAGHGLLDKKLNYYLSTTDVDFSEPAEKGISYDSLIMAIEKIPARSKVLFIDACHSGELDKDDVIKSEETTINDGKLVFRSVNGGVVTKAEAMGLKKSLEFSKMIFTDLRKNNGVAVISSAGGAEYAIEGEKWNNGIFTYCLLNGMKKSQSDINNDGKIFLSELQEYLTREVKRISNGLQVPTSRSENIYNDFLIK